MDCYHCGTNAAKLKCADCDSKIFRFCSQRCGIKAHDEHSLLCYKRFDPQHLEDQLLEAIDEMVDPQEIDDALDVLIEMEDKNPETMKEAHEIIQAHLEYVGFEHIEKLSETEKAARDARRAAAREASAQKRRARAARRAQKRQEGGTSAMSNAERRAARRRRRAEKYRKRAARQDTAAERDMARGQRRQAAAQKPGMLEKWDEALAKRDDAAAARYARKGQQGLAPAAGGDGNSP